MPSISLPTINIPEEGLKSKETTENILDTLQKYRKELNFLLMNLDLDNMPTIGGLMGDLEGDYSLISQTVDGIILSVGNVAGDVSALQLQADSISATVANNTGDIASLVITAQGIQTQVTDNLGHISTLTQTATSITSQVASLNTEVGSFFSQINQLSNEISSIVSFTDVTGLQIASKISQSPGAIELIANEIDITGITTIYAPDSSNSYARFDNLSDFYIFSGGNRVFEVYNGIDYSMIKAFGRDYLSLSDATKRAVAYGKWDFTSATVNGLTARFG